MMRLGASQTWLRSGVFLVVALIATTIISSHASSTGDLLTREEREWLADHPVIRLAYEAQYPPFTFVDSQGKVRGLSVDYIRNLEQKLGIRFEIVPPNDLKANLEKARSRDVDVLTSLMKTPERSGYLLFTQPYVTVPAVIIARKGYTGPVTLDSMRGVRIAVCTDYAVTKYLEKTYPYLSLILVKNEVVSLRMLSLGEVDAAVVDMASASHSISSEGIGNLRVAGDTGFTYSLSLATRSDWPQFNRILEKGLAGITVDEAQAIRHDWITLEQAPAVGRAVWIVILAVLGLAVAGIIVVVFWNRSLSLLVEKRSRELTGELEERRQAEAALRLSKERLNLATHAAGIGIWDWDIANNRLTWDDGMYTLFGIRPEDFTGDFEAWSRTLHPEDVSHAETGIQAALRAEREYVSEFRIVRPDGMARFIQADSQTFFADDGTPRRMLGINYDITKRKQNEEALRTSEQSLRNLLMAMPIAVALNDERQMITFRNRHFVQLFGYTEDEVPSVAEWMRRAYPDEQVREWVTKTWQGAVQKALDEGTDIEMHEYPVTCKNGEVRIVEIGGIMLGKEMLITLLDISERKRSEEMLEKRLVALTQPMAGGDVTFEELFNVDDVQRLQDEFSAATGVASLITRPDGTAITTPSNFVRLCSEIIRTSEKGCLNCLKSDAAIGRYHPDGPIVQHCLSGGLWDAGASITVGGRHIANWLVGQVRDETQTEEEMRAYAREIGVDEGAFIEAFYEVPAMLHEQFARIAQALFTLSGQLSTAAYQNIQQARFITERKRAEDTVRKALAEKETLIRELYHRTKNNLQIVRSLMNLQASDSDSTETRAIVTEMDNRIQGLALVHEMLYQSGDLSNLDLTEYLSALARIVARNFWGHQPPVTIDLVGESLPVTLDIVTPCGLVINELLSNTFKYAFPGGEHGVITVRIRRDGPEYLLLEYADNGVGLPEGFDPRSLETLGMQSIFAIVEQQLSGEVRVENAGGLRFILRIATGHYQERV